MYKIAAIGDKDSIYGLASLGIKIFPCSESADAIRLIRTLSDSGYGVIYITEQIASLIRDELEKYSSLPLPAIVPIPGVRGSTGFGLSNVSRFVEKAVGSDIIS